MAELDEITQMAVTLARQDASLLIALAREDENMLYALGCLAAAYDAAVEKIRPPEQQMFHFPGTGLQHLEENNRKMEEDNGGS